MKIVLYNDESDKRAGEYLSHFFNCPLIYKENFIYKDGIYDNVYLIGNVEKEFPNSVKVCGEDRYETLKEVLKLTGKI